MAVSRVCAAQRACLPRGLIAVLVLAVSIPTCYFPFHPNRQPLRLVRLHGLSRREYGSPFQLLDRFSGGLYQILPLSFFSEQICDDL